MGRALDLRRAVGRRVRPLPPLPRGHRDDGRPRVQRVSLRRRVGAHRARGRAGSRAPRSTTTAACSRRASSTASPRSSPTTTSRRRAGSPMPAAGSSADAPDRFARYSGRVTEHIGDLVPWVCTVNEANIIGMLMATASSRRWRRVTTPTCSKHRPDGPRSWPSPKFDVMAAAHRKALRRDQVGARRDPGRLDASRSSTCRRRPVATSGWSRCVRPRSSTGSTSHGTTTVSACRPTRASGSVPRASCRRPTARRPRRPAGRSIPMRSGTRCGWLPSTPAPDHRHRERSRHRRRRRPHRLHRGRAARTGRGDRRRRRRPRVHALDLARQLRVGLGLHDHLRSDRLRPHDLRRGR